jgi:ribosome-binding factor A
MTASKRMARVDELLLREIGALCEELVAPRAQALITITKVQCAPDLHDALVFVSVLGDDGARTEAMRLMGQARRDLQRELGRRVILKYTPRLHFREDRTAEEADRVLALLDELKLPEGQGPDHDAADALPE